MLHSSEQIHGFCKKNQHPDEPNLRAPTNADITNSSFTKALQTTYGG
jgi:hypothetical protein